MTSASVHVVVILFTFYLICYTLSLFDLHDHIHTSLVASAFKLRVQPYIYDHFRELCTYHSCAKCKHITVIVCSGHLRCKRLAANCCTHSFDLVCCKRYSQSCTANQDSTVHFFCNNCTAYCFPILRIVTATTSCPFSFRNSMISAFNSNAEWSFPIPILMISLLVSLSFSNSLLLSNIQR